MDKLITVHLPSGQALSASSESWLVGILQLLSVEDRAKVIEFVARHTEIPLINGMVVESKIIPAGHAELQIWGGSKP